MLNHGSVQHLNELSDEEKAVFKTFKEISPMEIILRQRKDSNTLTRRSL
jgi:hypothetical protein